MSRDESIIVLIESLRDEFRTGLQEVKEDIAALKAKPAAPAWVRTVAVAALTAVVSAWAVRAASHVQWSPTPTAEVRK